MSKKKDSERGKKIRFWDEMRNETVQAILAIFCLLITILSLLAAFNKAGIAGDYAFTFFSRLFGVGYYLIPIVFAMLAVSFLQGLKKKFEISRGIGALLFFISGLGLVDIAFRGADYLSGGIVGSWISMPLLKLFDYWATTSLLVAVFIISVIMTFNLYFTLEDIAFWKKTKVLGAKKAEGIDDDEQFFVDEAVAKAAADGEGGTASKSARELEEERLKKIENEKKSAAIQKGGTLDFTDDEESSFASSVVVPHLTPFAPPPLSLLEKDRGKPETGDIKANANIIKRTLQNFGITVEMDEISIGPSVTRYALKPAEGVKLSRIVVLNNDLALALAAHPIRIEAPIPGKSLVGIEVPNTAKTTVGLATLLSSLDYQESEKPLLMSLGKDIAGRAHFSNLGKAPHMLIAGATGSGKSVTIHALITSLLYRNSPENLKFIMIDPKRVELTMYNKIPHLLTPVITDPKKAILALKWAAKEMSRRYDVLEQNASRDIDSYHKSVLGPALERYKAESAEGGRHAKSSSDGSGQALKLPETMPYIVIVIDELADIMQTYPRELESAIVRLAQMSRATGIHLIISTQRPSVNVITGLIKANIPSRIALQVASQIDSRTILDQMGAEKLLGAGDMLYLGGEMSKPVRLQAAFISESEVKRVVKHLADAYKDEILSEISLTPTEAGATAAFDSMAGDDSFEEEDELYEAAREAVSSAGKASTSYIQRKLGVGYSRAAKLMDMLEEHGVIGPANGSKPREVMATGAGNAEEGAAAADQPTT
ncbi:MAG: segregation ATPase FtsK/SpoIIIE, family [Candidatus Parcubacteria bacterium]|jgi:S-DNA-T family DNA segregation ATPase FtsK/SpoIIIE|nr:segregation ATPase FtsK/SpoIIIE, family [Candidatus Parcubacteria bacterium]